MYKINLTWFLFPGYVIFIIEILFITKMYNHNHAHIKLQHYWDTDYNYLSVFIFKRLDSILSFFEGVPVTDGKCSIIAVWDKNLTIFLETGISKELNPSEYTFQVKVIWRWSLDCSLFTASKVLQVEQQVHPDPSDMMTEYILGDSVDSLAELYDSW